ncbi:Nuclear transcription factor Y subunit B-3 [Acorus gramineus]|uniref:Nuclear transcription factor Y subunit B-3 n=1 Tax=Acorus gramineus TaxID=55184 RepID=A0AAV9ASS3_ACOGR|nr:Nuclear transcription factor Y subunit B-3 [Acorus gramineus]
MKGRKNHFSPTGSPPSDTDSGVPSFGGDPSSKEQDRFLPIANVSRIMKRSLPANAKISKEAKETVQECVSEFISFITGEASDKCQREKRKTVNGDDLLWAMTTLGFENYVGPLKVYLNKYRETEGEKTSVPARQGVQSLNEIGNGNPNPNGGGNINLVTPMGQRGFDGGFYSPAVVPQRVGGGGGGGGGGKLMEYGEQSRVGGGVHVDGRSRGRGLGNNINHGWQW